MKNSKLDSATKNVHIGTKESDPQFGSVVPPIYPTSTFEFSSAKEGALRFAGKKEGMIYSRLSNPTVQVLEKRLAAMEGAEMAIATSSGMSAIATVLLHFLRSGDSIIADKVLYGGTYEFISRILPRYGITVHFVDMNNEKEVASKIDKNTKLIYFETLTNPLLGVVDVEKVVKIAKKHKIITVVDNTFSPPPCVEPYKMGVDIIVHSITKYVGGHSDVIGGAIIGSKKMIKPIFEKSFIFMGPSLSPFTAYLAARGMTTLGVRMKKQQRNALKIAKYLESHEKIGKIYYPALKSHPQYELAKKQMKYFGAVLSFEMKDGYKAGEKLVDSVELITLAVSLGAVETLIEHPASMTHSELTPEERKDSGIGEGLIRLAIGIEDPNDLIADLDQALKKV